MAPQKIHTRNLITKKIPAARKFPFPLPHNFSNGPSLSNQTSHSYGQTVVCDIMTHGTLICQVLKDSKQCATLETRRDWGRGSQLLANFSQVTVPDVLAKIKPAQFPLALKWGICDMVAL